MNFKLKNALFLFLVVALLTGCVNFRRLLVDEVVLKDKNSVTGTILKSDSIDLKIKKTDESITIIPWTNVDTVQGKKLKTLFLGLNVGYYNAPFFSVFKNEAMAAKGFGMQYKLGFAMRGRRLYYINLSYVAGKPYSLSKFGPGYQRYFKKGNYIRDKCFFIGTEFNFMKAQYNDGRQFTFEPFGGFEKKIGEQLRLHVKLGLQFNLANKNNATGASLTIGLHFMKRNFKKYYDVLNTERRLPSRLPSKK